MQFVRDLLVVLRQGSFRRLFAVRASSQLSDGIFQVALAAYVLFSPEAQPTAGAIAAGFAVLLLPFSLLGPFCGVLIDRWSRRQILWWSNAVRVVAMLALAAIVASGSNFSALFLVALVCLSVNRFLLAALSAALPHVVPRHELVMANAVTPTCGTLCYLVGVAIGSGLQLLARPVFTEPDVAVLLVAALGYTVAALLPLRLGRDQLGPDFDTARPGMRESVRHVAQGLVDGGRHVLARRRAAYGLGIIAVHRFCYGIATVATLLAFRNYFYPGDENAALGGMATVVLVSGIGYGLAALSTPVAVTRIGKESWIAVLLVIGGVALAWGALFTEPAILVAAFALGLSAQGIKICVDTLVHENIDDVYRGRVFSFYDVLFNVIFVASASFVALVVPETGVAPAVLVGGAVGYLIAAATYRRLATSPRLTPAVQPTTATTPRSRLPR